MVARPACAVLVALASGGTLCAVVAVMLIEVFRVGLVYFGLFPVLTWMVLIALSLAREYRVRVDQFMASDTGRKRAEETLNASQATLQSILETAPDHVMTANRQGQILFVNRTLPHQTAAEVIGSSIFSHVPPNAEPVIRAHLERVFQTGASQEFETLGPLLPSGARGYWLVRVGPVYRKDEIVAAVFLRN